MEWNHKNEEDYSISLKNIIDAHNLIAPFIHKTPIFTSRSLNKLCNSELFFKCENFQKVGAFKIRGALNALLSLKKEDLSRGVATHSSGNHAQAIAYAAQLLGIKATIVMPSSASQIKVNAVRNYNAEIIFCKPTLQSREETLNEFVSKNKSVFIHPYDNPFVIAGQGTVAKETLEEIDNLDYIVAPVGGGGLLSGTSIATKGISPKTKVIGAEPKGADDAFKSIRDNKLYPSIEPKTIADGLLTSLSERTFNIIKRNVEQILTVSEENIINAMFLLFERMKIVVEPSAAVSLAAVIEHKDFFEEKKVAIILSGGNVDLRHLPWLE
ncbi:MAG: threonine/serine dehydratase [Ignavibacteria bacterium]|nr:threonine/serine dehydratase [Ignavibacteria bacterium]